MAKAKVRKVVVKCECSSCGQVASVEPNKEHAFCRGFKIVKPLPAMFSDLKNPKRMGKWVPYVEPKKDEPIETSVEAPVTEA
jgi:hypothetical protein